MCGVLWRRGAGGQVANDARHGGEAEEGGGRAAELRADGGGEGARADARGGEARAQRGGGSLAARQAARGRARRAQAPPGGVARAPRGGALRSCAIVLCSLSALPRVSRTLDYSSFIYDVCFCEQVKREELATLELQSQPLRGYLMQHVMPTLSTALMECVKARPDDPVDFLAEYLFHHNPQVN